MAPAPGGFIFTDRWTNLLSAWEPHGRRATTEARTVGELDIARVARPRCEAQHCGTWYSVGFVVDKSCDLPSLLRRRSV
jgi:hypothetical protein